MKHTPYTFDEHDFHIRDAKGDTIALIKLGVPDWDLFDLIALGHLMASAPDLTNPSDLRERGPYGSVFCTCCGQEIITDS